MRRSINILLCLTIVFGLPLTLSAQTDEELNQQELLKKFTGTWEAEVNRDTVIRLTFDPYNNGFILTQENKAGGATFYTVKAIVGVSMDMKTIVVAGLGPNGIVGHQIGKFVSDNKEVLEFYLDDAQHPRNIQEFVFQSPDAFTARGKSRGDQMTWDVDWGETVTFNKIK